MDDLQATYKDDDLDDDTSNNTTDMPDPQPIHEPEPEPEPVTTTTTTVNQTLTLTTVNETLTLPTTTSTTSTEELSDIEPNPNSNPNPNPNNSPNFTKIISSDDELEDLHPPPPKKLKQVTELSQQPLAFTPTPPTEKLPNKKPTNSLKKKKTKGNNVWTKPTSRKGKKRTKSTTSTTAQTEDSVLITPVHRYPDKTDDSPDMKICLSKVYKAEKVELTEDRMSAGSSKGYRMVRATRGVMEGAWYYEIKVVSLGESGHTRLGWSTEKGDLQAPVGYDGNSYGYRDVDGSKVHKALREKYGEGGYGEGDVIGFYVNLPDGCLYAPKAPQLVLYKGQRYAYATADGKDEPPKVVPGSEICFFKNGICQGSAFKDLHGGRYYPAASMYTLPHQSNCVVKFNFGPDFEAFPQDFGQRPIPKPMVEVPYHGFDGSVQNGNHSGLTRACPMLKVIEDNEY